MWSRGPQRHNTPSSESRGPRRGLHLSETTISGKGKPPALVRMKLAGAQTAEISGYEPLPGGVNYFLGSDPAKWTSGIATYGKVLYKQVYKGIDLV